MAFIHRSRDLLHLFLCQLLGKFGGFTPALPASAAPDVDPGAAGMCRLKYFRGRHANRDIPLFFLMCNDWADDAAMAISPDFIAAHPLSWGGIVSNALDFRVQFPTGAVILAYIGRRLRSVLLPGSRWRKAGVAYRRCCNCCGGRYSGGR